MKLRKGTSKSSFIILYHIITLITVAFWATSFLSTKVLMERGGFSPVEMFVYRFAFAYLILLLITFKKIKSNNWKDELTFIFGGICSGSLYFITENYALQLTSAGNVSLLVSLTPLITTLMVATLYHSKLSSGVIIGSVVALTGAALIILSGGNNVEFRPQGDILALASALCWALYTVLIRRVLPLYKGIFITRKLFFYGVITALPLLIIQKEPTHFHLLFDISHPEYLLNLIYLVFFCSILAYWTWNESIKKIGEVTTNNYLYLQPMITMIAAYFLIGEKIYVSGYLGCALIILGLIISDKWKGAISFKRK